MSIESLDFDTYTNPYGAASFSKQESTPTIFPETIHQNGIEWAHLNGNLETREISLDFYSFQKSQTDWMNWFLETGIWDGYEITPETAALKQEEMEKRFFDWLSNLDPSSDLYQTMMMQLAYLGGDPELKAYFEQENGFKQTGGIWHCIKKGYRKTEEFCNDHPYIAAGIAIAVAATVVTAVVIYTGSTAATAAVAGVAGAVLGDSSDDKPTLHSIPEIATSFTETPPTEPTKTPGERIFHEDGIEMDGIFTTYQEIMKQGKEKEFLDSLKEKPLIENTLASSFSDFSQKDASDGYALPDPPATPFLDQYEAFLDNLKLELRKEQEVSWQQTLAHQREQQIITSGRRPESGDKYSHLATYGNFTSGYKAPPPFSEIPLIGKEGLGTIHYHCGINNTSFEVKEAGYCLKATLEENYAIQPHLIHKDSMSHGLTMVGLKSLSKKSTDLIHALCPATKAIEKTSQMILEYTKIQNSINYEVEFLSDVAQQILDKGDNKLKQVHATFSNGGYVFKKALEKLEPEYRDTIIVITCGTTEIIEDGLAHKVYNVIGDKDWPSKICNGGMNTIEKAGDRAEIDIIEQNKTLPGIGGHYIMQPEYQNAIKQFIKDSVKPNYEIY